MHNPSLGATRAAILESGYAKTREHGSRKDSSLRGGRLTCVTVGVVRGFRATSTESLGAEMQLH